MADQDIQKEPPRAEAAPVLPAPPDAANPFRLRAPLWRRIFNRGRLIAVTVVALLILALGWWTNWFAPAWVQVSGRILRAPGAVYMGGHSGTVSFRAVEDPDNPKKAFGDGLRSTCFQFMCPPGRYKVIFIEDVWQPDVDPDSILHAPPPPRPLDDGCHPTDDDNPRWFLFRKRYRDTRLTPWIVTVPREGLKDLVLEAED